jgi:hypothetical protein
MNRVYESRLSIHSGLMTMGRHGRSRAREVVVIPQRERERGGHHSSHQLRYSEKELRRWAHDGAQQRWPVVLQWEDDSRRKEDRLEPGWMRWIMMVLSSRLV